MTAATPLITLTTDFGHDDVFVGVMKGVIAGISPSARVVDLTHSIPAFDVVQAAFRLLQAYPYFPKGSIHVVVVDPGVGSDRRVAVMQSDGHTFLAPDNGLLALIDDEKPHDALVEVTHSNYLLPHVSATFHGRDIFAPAAAHLANSIPLTDLGPPLDRLQPLDIPKPHIAPDSSIRGTVLWADHFGNLITNIPSSLIESHRKAQDITVLVGPATLKDLHSTYADVAEGQLLAMIGSFDRLEIAARLASAQTKLQLGPGTDVIVSFA